MMELLYVKLLSMGAIFVSMIIAAVVPIKFRKSADIPQNQAQFLSYSNCLAGGVFLGTCFIGLFPTVKAKFSSVLHQSPDSEIPVAELTIMMGYFLMMFMEQIGQIVGSHSHKDNHGSAGGMEMKERKGNLNGRLDMETSSDEDNEIFSRESHPLSDNSHNMHHGHSHGMIHTSPLRQYMLLLALSIHSIFEGAALGLQETNSKAIHLCIAILLHEVLVALAFGLSLVKLDLKPAAFIRMVVFFCVMIPVGVVVGIAVGRVSGFAGELASAIMQGLAAGTFIYVVFAEILPNELDGGPDQLWRITSVFIGFMIFSGIQFITVLM